MTIVSPGGVLLGLASALSFGIGDFAGGLASRRASGLAVAALGQLVGTVLLAVFVLVARPGLPDMSSLAIGAAAGLSGAVGVAALYVAMAAGAMGLVASVSGAGAVTVPLLVSVFLLHQSVHPLQAVGVACAAAAILAASGASRGGGSRRGQAGSDRRLATNALGQGSPRIAAPTGGRLTAPSRLGTGRRACLAHRTGHLPGGIFARVVHKLPKFVTILIVDGFDTGSGCITGNAGDATAPYNARSGRRGWPSAR